MGHEFQNCGVKIEIMDAHFLGVDLPLEPLALVEVNVLNQDVNLLFACALGSTLFAMFEMFDEKFLKLEHGLIFAFPKVRAAINWPHHGWSRSERGKHAYVFSEERLHFG